MGKLIRRRQVMSFFLLALAFSWTIWLLSPALSKGDEDSRLVVTLVGTYGPALSALLVSRVINPEPSGLNNPKRWVVFLLAFLAINLVWLLSTEKFGAFDLSQPVLFVSKQVLSGLVALTISGIYSKRKGVRDLLLPLTKWRVGPAWYIIVVLGPPLVIGLGVVLARLLNAPIPDEASSAQPKPWFQLAPGLILAYLQTLLFQGPLGEEPGWRGFALPRLKAAHGSATASIIIGVVWGLWHAPLYLTGIYPGGFEPMMGRLLWTVPLAFLFTWVYNRTGGSLLTTTLLHTSLNFQGDVTSLVLQVIPR